MKYLSTFSGVGGFELGIQQAYTQKLLQKYKDCGNIYICKKHAQNVSKKNRLRNIIIQQPTQSGVRNALEKTQENGQKEIQKNIERQVEGVEKGIKKNIIKKEENTVKKDDRMCLICTVEDANVVEKQLSNFSHLNILNKMDTKTEKNTELGTIINSHSKKKTIQNTKSCVTTAIMQEEGMESVPMCVGFSEIDKYATKTYKKHFPKHRELGDITKINEATLPDFDLLVGGFPCQSFSIAGKRGGFLDTRGTLFFDIARIVREKQPRLLLLENVKGLLSHSQGRTFFTIIATLDELGYDCQWQVLNAKDFGVPQNRERVFIVGHLRGTPRPEVFPIGGMGKENTAPDTSAQAVNNASRGYEARKDGLAACIRAGQMGSKNIIQLNQPTHSNDRVYGADGVSPTLNTMQGGRRQPFVRVPEATKKGYAEATVGQSINLSVMGSKTRRGRVSDVAQTLDTGMQQHTLTADAQIRRLTPLECERLMGLPDGWTNVEGMSDTQRYKQCGNGVVTNVVQAIVEKML